MWGDEPMYQAPNQSDMAREKAAHRRTNERLESAEAQIRVEKIGAYKMMEELTKERNRARFWKSFFGVATVVLFITSALLQLFL